ncbi:unnamed protein product [Ascophyllum nodosum]
MLKVPAYVANPAYGRLNGKNELPCPRSRLRIWSRETGSTVLSRVTPLILDPKAGLHPMDPILTHGLLPFLSLPDGGHLHRKPPSRQSQVCQVTQLRTDGVRCQESAGTGPVVLKVAQGTEFLFLQPMLPPKRFDSPPDSVDDDDQKV